MDGLISVGCNAEQRSLSSGLQLLPKDENEVTHAADGGGANYMSPLIPLNIRLADWGKDVTGSTAILAEMNIDLDSDSPAAEKRFKKREPIKTSTSTENTEPVAPTVPTTITVTDTDAEIPQERAVEEEEAVVVEAKKEDNVEEGGEAQKEKEDEAQKVDTEISDVKDTKEENVLEENNEGIPLPPAKPEATPKKAPKFKQRQSKQFKSKPPKRGVLGFGDDIPGMEGLGTDITVICPWEAFSHLELHELAQFGII
ncbi:uncharacterized protein LOC128502271 [Spea bombifrons]|uniref:uncharacterized protein LOC128502271 n=1 Tax=Spea bombifrons TaxID=233779 RepID=UPI00234A5635|nr:uncharacterized protein LOC128502271 [Spea bombifrons]